MALFDIFKRHKKETIRCVLCNKPLRKKEVQPSSEHHCCAKCAAALKRDFLVADIRKKLIASMALSRQGTKRKASEKERELRLEAYLAYTQGSVTPDEAYTSRGFFKTDGGQWLMGTPECTPDTCFVCKNCMEQVPMKHMYKDYLCVTCAQEQGIKMENLVNEGDSPQSSKKDTLSFDAQPAQTKPTEQLPNTEKIPTPQIAQKDDMPPAISNQHKSYVPKYIIHLKQYAKDVLVIALRDDALRQYLIGTFLYGVRVRDASGKIEECAFVKMEAIYDLYREKPDSHLNEKLEALLKDLFMRVKGDEAFMNLLRILEHIIVAQAEGRAPFEIDVHDLINRINQNLQENMELYTSELYTNLFFLGKVREIGGRFPQYGYPLMPGPVVDKPQ